MPQASGFTPQDGARLPGRRSARTVLAVGLAAVLVALMAVAFFVRPNGQEQVLPSTAEPIAIAVIGDVPYTARQVVELPRLVNEINIDPDVRLSVHLGDIKSSTTRCSDAYFERIKTLFDRFADPLVYTPGDNEWTDCHKSTSDPSDPIERLQRLREVFFAAPDEQLRAESDDYVTYADQGYPENVRFRVAGASFAAVHIVGGNDGLERRTGKSATQPEQIAEERSRSAADIDLIRDAFASARCHGDRNVVILTQADMFTPNPASQNDSNLSAFRPFVQVLAEQSAAFDGMTYLLNGDSHVFRVDEPLAANQPWPEFYDVAPAAKLRRITVDGDQLASGYLKVRIDPQATDSVTWQRISPRG